MPFANTLTRDVVIQKLIATAAVGLAVTFLLPFQVAIAFIVLGHGHFLAAYYYQWKAGKTSVRGLAAYVILTAIFLVAGYLSGTIDWLIISASIIFFIHHFQDEIVLFGKEHSLYRTFEQLPGFLVLSSLVIDNILGTSLTMYAVAVSIVLCAALLHATFVLKKHRLDELSAFFAVVAAGYLYLWISGTVVAPEKLIGSVILFHYACWYVYYYFRFASKPERRKLYVKDMLAIHGIVFGAYALTVYSTFGAATFGQAFTPVFFYVAAILHIVFSARLSDYKGLLRV